jgi:hypothetical protein
MTELLLVVVDFAPGPAAFPYACAERAVGLSRRERDDFEDLWVASDGHGTVTTPASSKKVSMPSHEPVLGNVQGWRIELRSQPDLALALTRDGARRVIPLPPVIAEDVRAIEKGRPALFWARGADVVGIVGKHRVSWVSASQLQASGDRIDWRVRRCLPTGDASAHDAAEVTLSAHGRTHIKVGGRVVTAGPTPLTKGEQVTLVERLVDAYGILAYAAVVRADGSRLPLAGPIGPMPSDVSSYVQHESSSEKGSPTSLDPRTTAAVEGLRREGLLRRLTPDLLDDLFPAKAWARASPDLFTVLEHYYADRARALEDRASVQEDQSIDAITVKGMCELAGQPLLRCTRAARDHLELEARSGATHTIDFDELPLFRLAETFDGELAASGDARRFHRLSSRDDARCILFLMAPDVAQRLIPASIDLRRCGW